MADDLFSGGPEQWLMNMSPEELKKLLCQSQSITALPPAADKPGIPLFRLHGNKPHGPHDGVHEAYSYVVMLRKKRPVQEITPSGAGSSSRRG